MINHFFPIPSNHLLLNENKNPFFQNKTINNNEELTTTLNKINIFNINSETYYFNRRMKSRFFNNEKCIETSKNNFESFSTNSDSNSNKSDSEIKNISKDKNNDVMYLKQKNKNKNKIQSYKKGKKGKFLKGFKERDGDWTCYYCKNLNFTFRNICNRCHITKDISDKGHEKYFQDVLNQINVNEEERKKLEKIKNKKMFQIIFFSIN